MADLETSSGASGNEDVGVWFHPFGVYVWSDRLRFRFSWGPYFAGGWRPSFRRLRGVS